jgi:hypothetical protein
MCYFCWVDRGIEVEAEFVFYDWDLCRKCWEEMTED